MKTNLPFAGSPFSRLVSFLVLYGLPVSSICAAGSGTLADPFTGDDVPAHMCGGTDAQPVYYLVDQSREFIYRDSYNNVVKLIDVGNYACRNHLSINSGALVSADTMTVGYGEGVSSSDTGNDNEVTVSGAGTVLNLSNAANQGIGYALNIGYFGSRNKMKIQAGVLLAANGNIEIGHGAMNMEGYDTDPLGCHNQMIVSGAATTVSAVGLYVGLCGDDNLFLVKDGAHVTGSYGQIGGSGCAFRNGITVSGADSSLAFTSYFQADRDFGTVLRVTSGGSFKASELTFGGWTVDGINNPPSILLTGENSSIEVTDSFEVEGDRVQIVMAEKSRLSAAAMRLNLGDSSSSIEGCNLSMTVMDRGTVVETGLLVIGGYGSGNLLTIANESLVKAGQQVVIRSQYSGITQTSGSDNCIGMAGGYLAIVGDVSSSVATWIDEGKFKVWNADSQAYQTATRDSLTVTYYGDEAQAEAATGYASLSGYTVVQGGDDLPGLSWSCLNSGRSKGGWYDSTWYGWFYTCQEYGDWIYSFDHGFQCIMPGCQSGCLYLWDDITGSWWYTQSDFFPAIYVYRLNRWYSYVGGSTPNRTFLDYQSGAVIPESSLRR